MDNTSFQVLDFAQPFCVIENYVLEDERLTAYDVTVYLALRSHAGARREDGSLVCWPSVETLAKKARCVRSTCFKSLAHLEELGYLRRESRYVNNQYKKTTLYQLLPNPRAAGPSCGSDESAARTESVKRTASVRITDSTSPSNGRRTRYYELDTENYNPPLIPPKGGAGEAASPSGPENPDEQGMIADSPDESLAEELTQKIQADFPRADAGKLRAAVRRWIEAYGRERVEGEIPAALLLQCEKGGRYRDPVRYIGAWLRRGRKAPPPVVASRIDELFEEFWAMWPGLRDGKEGARREWRRRFSALPDAAARNGALRALEPQIEALIERAERGEELRFLGKAQNFIRDADLAG